MGHVLDLQAAMVSGLAGVGSVTGVYHDAPARAPFPYIVLTSTAEKRWNSCGRPGREIQLEITLWDDQSARLLELEDVVEQRALFAASGGDTPISSIVFVGKKRTRDAAGPCSCTLAMRVRLYLDLQETGL